MHSTVTNTPTEQRGMISDNQKQTGNADEDDLRHKKPQNIKDEQYLRVGQWIVASPANQTTSHVPPENLNVSRRTGTDLQNEEHNMMSVDSTPGPRDALKVGVDSSLSFRHACTVPWETLETTNPASSPVQHYYQFEWFRILIGQMLLASSFVVLMMIYFLGATRGKVMGYWSIILRTVSIELIFLLFYIVTFVVLTHYHGHLGKFGERWTGISRPTQRKWLRISAYLYIVGVMFALGCSIGASE